MASAPPLGLMPRDIWNEKMQQERLLNILEEIRRYSEAGMPVPVQWVEELFPLLYPEGVR